MPLYEYGCTHCSERFERLVRGADGANVCCPRCGSENVQKFVSTFAALAGNGSSVPMASSSGCGGCGGGCACSR